MGLAGIAKKDPSKQFFFHKQFFRTVLQVRMPAAPLTCCR